MNLALWQGSRYWLAAGWTMFHFLWIGAALWLAAASLRAMLSRAGPAVRYCVALGLFLATAAVPGGLFLAGLGAADEMRSAAAEIAAPSHRPDVSETAEPSLPAGRPSATELTQRMDRPSGPSSPQARFDALAFGVEHELLGFSCRWFPWLWLAGTPLTLLVLACGATGAEVLRRGARPLEEGELAATFRRLQTALHVGRRVALALSDRVTTPLLVGIVRPIILLPPAILTGCSPEQIEMILIHELAHVRRRDNLVGLVQRLIEALLFFHPVVWWLSRWVRLEREECCDQIVLAHTNSPQIYAETLAALAAPGMSLRHPAVALTDSHLVVRIRHILNLEQEQAMSVSRKGLLAFAIVLVGGVMGGTWYFGPSGTGGTSFAQNVPATDGPRPDKRSPPSSPNRVKILDVLSIRLVNDIRKPDGLLRPGDEVRIRGTNLLPVDPLGNQVENEFRQINGPYLVQPDGTVDLGPVYGSVTVGGMTMKAAREALLKHLRDNISLAAPKIAISLPAPKSKRPLSGAHLVRPDGTVSLGDFGSVYVNDLTLDEVKSVVEDYLADFIDQPEVQVALARPRAK